VLDQGLHEYLDDFLALLADLTVALQADYFEAHMGEPQAGEAPGGKAQAGRADAGNAKQPDSSATETLPAEGASR
jgi:hypothetical protein